MERRCARCGVEKSLQEFGGGSPQNPKRDCYCRPCRAEYGRIHYLANRRHYVEKAKQRNDAVRERNYELLVPFLLARRCVDCGERDVLVLEFDHIVDKSFMIGRALRERSWPQILAEIEKCEVVCANCHRRRTAKRGGFARYVAARRHRAATDAEDCPPPK